MEIGRGNGSLTNRFSVVGSQLSTTEHRQPKTVFRRLAQSVEHHLHTVGVAGSSPAAPTNLDSHRYCATLGSEIPRYLYRVTIAWRFSPSIRRFLHCSSGVPTCSSFTRRVTRGRTFFAISIAARLP